MINGLKKTYNELGDGLVYEIRFQSYPPDLKQEIEITNDFYWNIPAAERQLTPNLVKICLV